MEHNVLFTEVGVLALRALIFFKQKREGDCSNPQKRTSLFFTQKETFYSNKHVDFILITIYTS